MAKSATKRKSTSKAPKAKSGRAKPTKTGQHARNISGLIPHQFGKGNPGKPKGAKNKFGVILKDAILQAAELSGRDGKGKDGAVGYLVWLSRAEPAVYGRMLEKVMPTQLEVKDTTKKTYTPAEAKAALEARGLPVPQSLTDLVVTEIVQRVEEEVDNDEFNELAEDTPEIFAEQDEDEEEEDGGEDEQDEEAA